MCCKEILAKEWFYHICLAMMGDILLGQFLGKIIKIPTRKLMKKKENYDFTSMKINVSFCLVQ